MEINPIYGYIQVVFNLIINYGREKTKSKKSKYSQKKNKA